MTGTLSAADLWSDVIAVRQRSPLVHCITNLVAMNLNANVLLAAGASPVMAHAHEEVAEMAGLADALVLNIGTLEPYWVESMHLALQAQKERATPVVLDPVGAGATRYRDACIQDIFGHGLPLVIRGNASEIMSIGGQTGQTRGVDSVAATSQATRSAQWLARQTGGVVCVSGAIDHVVDSAGRWANIANGHPWMTRVTGVGCAESALLGAFCAVQADPWRASVAAMALMALAGEIATEKTIARQMGVGALQAALLDELQLLDWPVFAARLKVDFSPPH